jgi:hypothetical protein
MTEVNNEVETLKTKLAELEKKFNNLQYIVDNTGNSEKLSERLVRLGVVTEAQMKNVLSYKKTKVRSGKSVKWFHPDHDRLVNVLSIISKRLSKAKLTNDGRYPHLRRGNRSNTYEQEDYLRFGDKIIEAFLVKKPVEGWGIDWDWGKEGYVESHFVPYENR